MGLLRKEDMHESFWLEGVSNPNLLINGNFQVWQRGTSFVDIPAGKVIYNSDRWYTNSADSIFNIEKINKGLSITRVNNTNHWAHFAQALERNEALKLVGKYVTLTINCTLTTADIIQASIYSGTPTLNSKLSTIVLKTGKNIIITKIPEVLDNNDTIGVAFDFVESKIPNSNLQIHYVKLEEGSIATQFVSRPYGEELSLCKRYYQHNPSTSWYLFHRANGGGLRCDIPCEAMRTTPTLVFPSETIDIFNTAGTWESIPKSKCKVTQNFASQITIVINDVDTPDLADNRSYIAKNIPCFDDEIY